MPIGELSPVEIRVTLLDIEPAVWRRLVVPSQFHLGQLHLVVQAAFSWWNYHLHEFLIGGLSYGDPGQIGEPEFDDSPRSFDEREVRLLDFHYEQSTTFLYRYDFGDNWRHEIELKSFVAADPVPKVASCIGGARARPPEDVGGVYGYANFLAIMADPTHPEHRATKQWYGGHFDPEHFDLPRTDRDVRAALRPNRRLRKRQ
jgi:hypothetical protein